MGAIDLEKIIFSKEIKNDWSDSELFQKIKNNQKFINNSNV